MNNEIERKFLIKQLPDLSRLEKVSYERYFLYHDKGVELRVQHKGDKYELERKVSVSETERTREKIEISQDEFNLFKSLATNAIIRDSYTISDNPDISIKIYHGTYEGLIRAEVECDSTDELTQFEPPAWFGQEITHTPLARDGELMKLSPEEFKALLQDQQ
jgi:CYTH domain-containing protein